MTAPARVLVRSPNWLGDAVMAIPAIEAIARRFAGSAIAVAAPGGIAPLFESVGVVSQVVPLPARGPLRWRLSAEAEALRSAGADLAILLPNSFRSAWTVHRAGIPERWGYRSDLRGALLTRPVRRPRRRSPELGHHVHHYQELVRALGIEPMPPAPALVATEQAAAKGRAVLDPAGVAGDRPLIGLAPGAAYGSAKRWPPERFAALAATLMEQRGAVCLLLGGAGDEASGRAVESALARTAAGGATAPGRLVNLIGRTDLAAFIGLAARCRLFVSNDSGAMHVAAALGVPVVAVFGPTDEMVTHPLGRHEILSHAVWCRPCLLRECPIDHRCLTGVAPDAVLAAVARVMDGSGART